MRSVLPASTIMSESFSTISLGIAAGPTRQMQPCTWKATSVTPCSQKVGTSGSFFMRILVGTAIGRPLPLCSTAGRGGVAAAAALDRARGDVDPHRRLAAIVHRLHRQPVVAVQRLDGEWL